MNMGFFSHQGNQVKQLNHQVPDQDLSSSQSTGQSNQELSGSSEGTDGNYQKPEEIQMKTALSLGSSDATFLPPKIDYSHSIACVPFPYVDPYYGGVFAAYGSHAIIHPQIAGFASSGRVPLPLEPAAEEPIYVNAKQYAAILRRRQLRAKLEAQNKVVKARKPYLHESRHLHAMKRARGSGGRFLNTKQLQQNAESSGSKATTATSGSMTVEQCQFGFSPSVGDGRGSMTGNGSEYDYP